MLERIENDRRQYEAGTDKTGIAKRGEEKQRVCGVCTRYDRAYDGRPADRAKDSKW